MENDMKAISAGAKRKSEVLSTCLEQTKACFLDARQNKGKLFEAMEIFFQRSNRSNGDELHGEIVRTCNVCQESNMVLRRKPDGNFMVGCLRFPLCRNAVWLPGPISSATVTSQVCTYCTPGPVYKIQFNFRRIEIPSGYNPDHLGCIGGCDETLRELIEICGTGSRIPSSTPVRGRSTMESSSAQRRSTARQAATCNHCRQTGHSSNDCPSQVPRSRTTHSGRSLNSQNGTTPVVCNSCGSPCALRTANTVTNRGRRFYSCQECNFFIWEDSIDNSMGRGNALPQMRLPRTNSPTRRGARGRGRQGGGPTTTAATFVTATGEPVSGRRCYSCGDPSHFANVCPNRGT